MEDFKKLIKKKENPRRKGFDSKSKTWRPHKSAEGGTDTIGWGHKLTPAEQAGGYVVIGKEKVPFNELTEAKNNALFEQDWNNNTQLAATFINEKGDWNSLSEPQKLVSTELFFNMGPNKAKQFKTFRDKIIAQDEGFIEEINRTYTNPEGETRSLTERTDPIKAWYRGQTKKEEAPEKQSSVFTGEKINVAGLNNDMVYGGSANLYANQNLPNAPRNLERAELPPDQTITPYRETIKEDVTVRPDQIRTTETIGVTAPRYSADELQERARRSMMHGNYDDRMEDYKYDREYQEDYPYLYPRNTGSYALPQQQAAQRMMGGGMGYAQGGTVNQAQSLASSNQSNSPGLSLAPAAPNQTAQGVASLGRGGDSTLVHMQPQEVAGLQQLAQANGTSLTTNPTTGLPEAFSLRNMFKSMLPIGAGFAANSIAPGMGSAIAAGALTGGTVAAMSGDDVLAGTLTGGLGGYSGAGLETALYGDASLTGMANQNTLGGMSGASFNPALDSTLTTAGGGAAPLTQGSVFDPSINPGASTLDTIKQNLGVTKPIEGEFLRTADGFKQATEFVPGDNLDVAMKLGSPAVSMGLSGLEVSDFYDDQVEFNDPRDKYDPYSKLNLNKDTGISTALAADTGLRLLAKGGFLEGSGDGMSDDIPAMIDGDQPAALSTGEYVVSADVVSGLGNGSSEAGAKRLHAMMDRVRKATTGRKAQATEINPNNYLPA